MELTLSSLYYLRHNVAIAAVCRYSGTYGSVWHTVPMTRMAVPQYAPPTLVDTVQMERPGLSSRRMQGGHTHLSWALRSCFSLSDRCYKIRRWCGAVEAEVRCVLAATSPE